MVDTGNSREEMKVVDDNVVDVVGSGVKQCIVLGVGCHAVKP